MISDYDYIDPIGELRDDKVKTCGECGEYLDDDTEDYCDECQVYLSFEKRKAKIVQKVRQLKWKSKTIDQPKLKEIEEMIQELFY